MEGCRVYRLLNPPADWRERAAVARRVMEHCATAPREPKLTVQGTGAEALERTVAGLESVDDVLLWGYVAEAAFPPLQDLAIALTGLGVTVYLACDRLDENGRLHVGARVYCNPDPKQSTLMLTVPPHDPAAARRSLTGMLEVLRDAGYLGGDGFECGPVAEQFLTERKDVYRLAESEVRPLGAGEHAHMFRLVIPAGETPRMFEALGQVLAHAVGVPSQTYLKLQGPAPPVLEADLPGFSGPMHWKTRSAWKEGEPVDRLLLQPGLILSASYPRVQWSGQKESPHSEVEFGITFPVLTVSVSLAVDGDAVAGCLQSAVPRLERGPDMPLD